MKLQASHEIFALVPLSKSVRNCNIALKKQLFYVMKGHINMLSLNRVIKKIDANKRTRIIS